MIERSLSINSPTFINNTIKCQLNWTEQWFKKWKKKQVGTEGSVRRNFPNVSDRRSEEDERKDLHKV